MFQSMTAAYRVLALLLAISLVLVVTAFGLVEDSLFFQSDPQSAQYLAPWRFSTRAWTMA